MDEILLNAWGDSLNYGGFFWVFIIVLIGVGGVMGLLYSIKLCMDEMREEHNGNNRH